VGAEDFEVVARIRIPLLAVVARDKGLIQVFRSRVGEFVQPSRLRHSKNRSAP
jgi:hypothetical protein